jgi:glycosyltransferase involved in cell wall biosynthesis
MLAIRSALGEVPQNRTGWTGRQFQQMILNGLKLAQHVACVSQSTKDDVTRIADLRADRVSVVENGLNYPYSPMPAQEASAHLGKLGIARGTRFLFHIGGNQWYKNRLGLLQIFARLSKCSPMGELKLVMAGKAWTEAMCQFVRENELQGSVVPLPEVSNEDLRALYSAALALLFPSLQEGFGWPIIEAQACGCPVFTSNRAPMNDIGGGSAIYIDPENASAAADVIAQNLMTIDQLRTTSIANAARFSTESMISGYVTIYESLLRKSSTSFVECCASHGEGCQSAEERCR